MADGSSPRGRGTPAHVVRHAIDGRFIPAWAGNAPACSISVRNSPVHPRVGGERVGNAPLQLVDYGSSPRGRGTRRIPTALGASGRFIPAWAGNACRQSCASTQKTVHPRVGGERLLLGACFCVCSGSSPRGRGTRHRCPADRGRRRFIPAWAGNACGGLRFSRRGAVHPRVGGERSRPNEGAQKAAGSSPRGRGTHAGHRPRSVLQRFIPAWAGNAR